MMLAESLMGHAIVLAGTLFMLWLPLGILGAFLESWSMTGQYTWWIRHGYIVTGLAGNPFRKIAGYMYAQAIYHGEYDDIDEPIDYWPV